MCLKKTFFYYCFIILLRQSSFAEILKFLLHYTFKFYSKEAFNIITLFIFSSISQKFSIFEH
ncbi:hypothetical protein MCETHM1_01038 [Flavobacteriaceae bacterium]